MKEYTNNRQEWLWNQQTSQEQTMTQGFMFKALWPCTMYNVLFCPHGKYLVSILSFWADKVVGEGAYSNIQLTWLEIQHTLYTNNITKTHFLASLWKVNNWWLCSVHCQSQCSLLTTVCSSSAQDTTVVTHQIHKLLLYMYIVHLWYLGDTVHVL